MVDRDKPQMRHWQKIQTGPDDPSQTISNSGGVLNSTTGEEMDVMNLIQQLIILYIQEL